MKKFKSGQNVIVNNPDCTIHGKVGVIDTTFFDEGWSDMYDVEIDGTVWPMFEDELELVEEMSSI